MARASEHWSRRAVCAPCGHRCLRLRLAWPAMFGQHADGWQLDALPAGGRGDPPACGWRALRSAGRARYDDAAASRGPRTSRCCAAVYQQHRGRRLRVAARCCACFSLLTLRCVVTIHADAGQIPAAGAAGAFAVHVRLAGLRVGHRSARVTALNLSRWTSNDTDWNRLHAPLSSYRTLIALGTKRRGRQRRTT